MDTHHTNTWRAAWLATVVAVFGTAVPRAAAQDTTRYMTATLLKRLGEAVDGYRTGRPVYVVISRTYPYAVAGVFSTREDAVRQVRTLPGYTVSEPFLAAADDATGTIAYAAQPCYKTLDTSYICPDTIGGSLLAIDSVESVTVTVRARNGRAYTSQMRPQEAGAVFFTMSAVDKLLIPYYERLYGLPETDRIRAAFLRALTRGVGGRR